jgi:3-deoxy-7-phosphoheptulonate synthase
MRAMLIVMTPGATDEEIGRVERRIESMGFEPHRLAGSQRTAIGITGNDRSLEAAEFEAMPGVSHAVPVTRPFHLVSREAQPEDTTIEVAGRRLGGRHFTVIAGPCAVETLEQTLAVARRVKAAGAHVLRGGAWKPRTSPYSFQGLGLDGLKILDRARRETGLPVITEAVDTETVDMVAEHADIIQIGARNMQNYSLLRRVGRTRRPVMLKRGMSATLDELLMSAEYIAAEGNRQILLCERGVRTFSSHARNTLDLAAVPALQASSHLPIFVDPSHGTGRRDKVLPLARAAAAVGAHGIMVEVHDRPEQALSDGPQAIMPDQLDALMHDVRAIVALVDRTV